jgi:CBS domain-containing protein
MELVQSVDANTDPYLVIRDTSATCEALAEAFEEHRTTAAIVGTDARGIVTEKDLVRLIAKGTSPADTPIESIVTKDPVIVDFQAQNKYILAIMHRAHFRHLPLKDEESGSIEGIIDIVQVAKELFDQRKESETSAIGNFLGKMFSFFGPLAETTDVVPTWGIEDMMKSRPAGVDGISQTTTVLEASRIMVARDTSGLLVLEDDTQKLKGIFTESDIVRKVISRGLDPNTTQVRAIMVKNPTTFQAHGSEPIEALKLMLANRYRHLPIVDEENNATHLLKILELAFESLAKALLKDAQSDDSGIEGSIVRGLDCFRNRVACVHGQPVHDEDEEEANAPTVPSAPAETTISEVSEKHAPVASPPKESGFSRAMKLAQDNSIKGQTSQTRSKFDEAKHFYSRALLHITRAKTRISNEETESQRERMLRTIAMASADLHFKRAEMASVLSEFENALADYETVETIAIENHGDCQTLCSWLNTVGTSASRLFWEKMNMLFELDRFEDAIAILDSIHALQIEEEESMAIMQQLTAGITKRIQRNVQTATELVDARETNDALAYFSNASRIITNMSASDAAKRLQWQTPVSLGSVRARMDLVTKPLRQDENTAPVTNALGSEKEMVTSKPLAVKSEIQDLGKLMMMMNGNV